MNINNEPFFTITVAEAEWVAKALGDPYGNWPFLGYAALMRWNGDAILVATDTYRIHLLRLGQAGETYPLPESLGASADEMRTRAKLVDLRRVVMEARFAKAEYIGIAQDLSAFEVGTMPSQGPPRFGPVHGPIFPGGVSTYLNYCSVIPETTRPVSEMFAINPKFLADALSVPAFGAPISMWSADAPPYPIVFRWPDDRWLAVVVPVSPCWTGNPNPKPAVNVWTNRRAVEV